MDAHIIKERKKSELDPMLKLLSQLEKIDGDTKDKDTRQFLAVISNMKKLGTQAGTMLDIMVKAEENKFTASLMKVLK